MSLLQCKAGLSQRPNEEPRHPTAAQNSAVLLHVRRSQLSVYRHFEEVFLTCVREDYFRVDVKHLLGFLAATTAPVTQTWRLYDSFIS